MNIGDEGPDGGQRRPFDPFGEDEVVDYERAPLTASEEPLSSPPPHEVFEPPGSEQNQGSVARSAAFFSIATALSRIVCLGREILVAALFGIKGPMSAFTIAFQIPNLMRSLFADAALQTAFIPVFVAELEKGNRKEAFRLAMNAMLLLTIVTGLLTAIFVLAAPFLVPLFAPGFKGELLTLTIILSQIMFPILILIGITSVIAGVLNSFHRFAAVAVAPIFWNLAIIATVLILTPQLEGDDRIYAYAIGVLLGTLVQLAIPAWDLRHTPFNFSLPHLREALKSPDVRRVVVLMLPVMLTIGLLNFNLLVNSLFGTLVSNEGPAAIDKAFRLYILPQGLTVVALTVVLYPTLSRYASRGEMGRLRDTLGNGMRQAILLTVPAMAALLALSEPIVRLIYQRGEFNSGETVLVASALFWLAFSLPFNGLLTMQNRTFFSMQEPWLPAGFAAINLALTAGIAAALYGPYGIPGIMFATAAASAIATVLQSFVLRRRLRGLEVMKLLSVTLRVLLASALLAGAAWEIWNLLEGALGTGLGAQILSVGLALGVGGAIYIGAVLAMKVPEAYQLLRVAQRIRD